jgi:hypothetical protein
MLGAMQSASTVHAALQADRPLHMYGAHGCVVAALQVPWPSQVRVSVQVDEPEGQVAGMQGVPAS